jgi:predicted RNA binding protein YcfA (HicA-like mRNA interferase family)
VAELACAQLFKHPQEAPVTVRIQVDPRTERAKLQLVLPDDIHDGPVSAVGTFNDWTPGQHRLIRRSNGTRSVTVLVQPGTEVRFRYLGSGGRWFDDPDAQVVDSEGSFIRV